MVAAFRHHFIGFYFQYFRIHAHWPVNRHCDRFSHERIRGWFTDHHLCLCGDGHVATADDDFLPLPPQAAALRGHHPFCSLPSPFRNRHRVLHLTGCPHWRCLRPFYFLVYCCSRSSPHCSREIPSHRHGYGSDRHVHCHDFRPPLGPLHWTSRWLAQHLSLPRRGFFHRPGVLDHFAT